MIGNNVLAAVNENWEQELLRRRAAREKEQEAGQSLSNYGQLRKAAEESIEKLEAFKDSLHPRFVSQTWRPGHPRFVSQTWRPGACLGNDANDNESAKALRADNFPLTTRS